MGLIERPVLGLAPHPHSFFPLSSYARVTTLSLAGGFGRALKVPELSEITSREWDLWAVIKNPEFTRALKGLHSYATTLQALLACL